MPCGTLPEVMLRTRAVLGAIAFSAVVTAPSLVAEQETGAVTPAVRHVTVPFTGLPSSSQYEGTLGALGGHLVVGMSSDSGCQLANVGATSLRVASIRSTACDDPALDGEAVMPVESLTAPGNEIGEVRIAVRAGSGSTCRLGPVVVRYLNYSDTRPEWTYGGGYLWLYSVGNPSKGAGGPALPAQVLRISLSTGRVLDRVSMPSLVRITLAADDDGLWFAPSSETGVTAHSKPPELLYFVPVGSRRANVIEKPREPGQVVNWLAAEGHTAWANVETVLSTGTAVTETFASPGSPPETVIDGAETPRPSDIGQGPFDAPAVLDAPRIGLLTVVPGWLGTVGTLGAPSETVISLDAATGGFSKVVTVKTLPIANLEADIVYSGALYLLTGQYSGGAAATVYRVPL
jgi:hypothetical protein